jgi:hypothetical protein
MEAYFKEKSRLFDALCLWLRLRYAMALYIAITYNAVRHTARASVIAPYQAMPYTLPKAISTVRQVYQAMVQPATSTAT